MKKLRLFFMMAFATLFAGMAFADGEATVVTPTVPDLSQYDIKVPDLNLRLGNGGDGVSTGIYKKAEASWALNLEPNTYWETPRTLIWEFQQMKDNGYNEMGTDQLPISIVADSVLVARGSKIPDFCEFVMDKLVPNTLYGVRVYLEGSPIEEPEVTPIPNGDGQGESNDQGEAIGGRRAGKTQTVIHLSEWKYFISAVPELKKGEMVWNWEDAQAIEGTDPVQYEYEYKDKDNQVDYNGGKLMWQFSKYNYSLSGDELPTTQNGNLWVTASVTHYEKVGEGDPTTTNFNSATGEKQMTRERYYKVEGNAALNYYAGEMRYRYNNDFPVYVWRANRPTQKANTAKPYRGYKYFGVPKIYQQDIHVGVIKDANGNVTAATVTVVNLPVDAMTAWGILKWTDKEGVVHQVLQNAWTTSRMIQFTVPTTEDFDFTIQLNALLEGHQDEWSVSETPQPGHVSFNFANTFSLTDETLLWSEKTYLMPLKDVNFSDISTDPTEEGKTHVALTYSYNYWGNRRYTVYGDVKTVGEGEDVEKFIEFKLNGQGLDEDTEFTSMTVSVESESFIREEKDNWRFYTSEGCVAWKTDNQQTGMEYRYRCADHVFDGSVYAIDPRVDPVEALMYPAGSTTPAPLYFFDWAWSLNGTPLVRDIKVEHKDVVTFDSSNADRTEFPQYTYYSEVKYNLPRTYNNNQTVGKLAILNYTDQEKFEAQKEEGAIYVNKEVVPVSGITTVEMVAGADNWGVNIFKEGDDYELWGPFPFYTVIKGEVDVPGGVKARSHSFTMADREGKIQLGTTVVDEAGKPQTIEGWEGNPRPGWVEQPTYQKHVLTLIPQFVVNNIYNWNYGTTDAHRGDCDFTIYATLKRTDTPTDAQNANAIHNGLEGAVTEWAETSATGHINKLGEVVVSSDLLFLDVDYEAEYVLEGYMLYTPKRYGVMTLNNIPELATLDVNPFNGPVVKVGFSYTIKTGAEFDGEAPSADSNIEYWIVSDGNETTPDHKVQVRIYDPDGKAGIAGTASDLELVVDLITNPDMPAPIAGEWVGPEGDEDGYYSFIFDVDNDEATPLPARYKYNYTYYYKQGSNYGDPTIVNVIDDETGLVSTEDFAIETPDPYVNYEIHNPNVVPYAKQEVGPWEDELWPFCRGLKNFFAFTKDDLPTSFQNWQDYYVREEAKNLVFGCYTPVTPPAEPAPGRRALTLDRGKKNYYAPIVRLSDTVNDDYKQNIYFNDVNFKAGDAKYTATFNYATRSVVMPFDAVPAEGATVTCYEDSYMNEEGSAVVFRFTQKKTNGVVDNTITANRPYIVKAAAGEVEFTGEEVAIGLSSESTTADLSLQIGGQYIKRATMTGLYEYQYNGQIVPTNVTKNEYYYRYSPKNKKFGELQKPSATDPTVDDYGRTYDPKFNAVKCFECYLYYMDLGNGNTGYSISIRFDDEDDDATMIENINVETESSELFDLMGRKVIEPVKGQIYIQNGKKILF